MLLRVGFNYLFYPHNKLGISYSESIYTSGNSKVGFTADSTKYEATFKVDKIGKIAISYEYSF